MNAPQEIEPALPESKTGFTLEHILISVTIAHTREIGQFDDSCAHQVIKGMKDYQGVALTLAEPLYKNCTIETHENGCVCHYCELASKTNSQGGEN